MTVSSESPREWLVVSPMPTGPFDGIVDFSGALAAAINMRQPARVVTGHAALADTGHTRGVFLQYSPHACVNARLPVLLSNLNTLRRRGVPVVTTVHEYWPPSNGSLKRGVWRWLCKRTLTAVLARSSAMVVTTPYAREFLAQSGIARAARAAVIPVGSNITPVARAHSNRQPLTIAMFGQPAALDRGVVLAMARWVERQSPRPIWSWNAGSIDDMRRWWVELGAPDVVEISGGRPAAELAALFARADLAVGPYIDGASTRRSSMAALLASRLPLVALDGRYTDDRLRASGAFLLSPLGDGPAFVANLERAIGDAALREKMAAAAEQFFETALSWPRIAAQYLAVASAGAGE